MARIPCNGTIKSSHNWLQEHVNDPYVKQAQKDGYRSRSSYKLIQLMKRTG